MPSVAMNITMATWPESSPSRTRPTLGALLRVRVDAPDKPTSMLVGMPQTPGMDSLPAVRA
jgi:hypothetical protein